MIVHESNPQEAMSAWDNFLILMVWTQSLYVSSQKYEPRMPWWAERSAARSACCLCVLHAQWAFEICAYPKAGNQLDYQVPVLFALAAVALSRFRVSASFHVVVASVKQLAPEALSVSRLTLARN